MFAYVIKLKNIVCGFLQHMTHDEYTLMLSWTIEFEKFELFKLLDRDGNDLKDISKLISLRILNKI